MENLFFWNAWEKSFRAFYLALLSLLALCMLAAGIAYFFGDTFTIGWIKDVEIETTSVITDTQTIDFFNFNLETNSYITRSWIDNGNISLYPVAGYAYLGIIVLAILVLLTVFTFLDLVYFLIGITSIIIFIISLNTELLSFLGWQHRGLSVLLIVVYAGTAYWLHGYSKNINLFKRFQLFTAITILTAIGVGLFAQTKLPFYQLAQSSLLFPFAATLFFLFLIGFENIRSFLYITSLSSQQDGKKSLLHFSIISLLYIGNALLLWGRNKFIDETDIILIHPLLLFLTAGITGIYGYKKRGVLFSDSLPFKPYGAFLYLALFIVSTATLAYGYFTANDTLYNSLEYFIIYSQLCLSLAFLLYVWINFAAPMVKNIRIYMYLYQPRYTPLFIAQGLGILGVVGLLGLNRNYSYDQSVAAHYNQLGDYYAYTGDTTLAYQFYNEGTVWDLCNQKGNYTMATMAEQQENYEKAYEHYNACLKRKPSPYAIVGLSGVYQHQKQLFPSFFMLKDGLKLFPSSGPLQNNLGLTYFELNIADSAFYLFQQAHTHVPEEASINLLYMAIKSGDFQKGDSLQQVIGKYTDPAFENNLFALNTALKKTVESTLFHDYADSLLTPQVFTYAYNYSINHLYTKDSSVSSRLAYWMKPEDNFNYTEDLIVAQSLNQYYGKEEARTALINIHELEIQHTGNAYYPMLLAHWYASKHRFDLAAMWYLKAFNNRQASAQLYYVLSLLESQQYEKASLYTASWLTSQDKAQQEVAKLVTIVASLHDVASALSQTDLVKLRFIRWNTNKLSVQERQQVAASIANPEIKAQAYLSLIEELLAKKQAVEALPLWNNIEKSTQTTAATIDWGNELYLKLLVLLQDWSALQSESNRLQNTKQAYYQGINALVQKDSATAAKNFIKALSTDPLEEDLAARALLFLGERDFMGYYDLILAQLLAYPESVKLSETYMLLCISNSMDSYADGELQRIEPYLNEEKYKYWKKTIKTMMFDDDTSVE
ncbi:MAG TPA: hypothetical protein VK750_09700 [Cytophagaceae bacterium]|jgi:hypothetical protein|nr:hypothetical protein [Cytophagaceae bacterium]